MVHTAIIANPTASTRPPTVRRTRATRCCSSCFMVRVLRSEGDVDAADPITDWRLRQEVGSGEVVLARLVQLRIESLVLRPSREVTTGEGEAERRGTDARAQASRRIIRQRQLTQFDEVRVLHVARLGAQNIRHRRSLLGEGCRRVVAATAIVQPAAELLGAIEELVPEPPIHQSIQVEALK